MNNIINSLKPKCNNCMPKEIKRKCAEEAVGMLISNDIKKDNVNHPSHYQGKHECIDEMIALFGVEAVEHFCMCNVYKYRYRAEAKNGQEDLDKADWYMDKLMELQCKKSVTIKYDNNGDVSIEYCNI